jgi:hypothetical protein
MKTALCLYGQPRTYEFCAPSIKEWLIEPYNSDVFVCTDSKGDELEKLYHPREMELITQPEIQEAIEERAKKMPKSVPNPGVYKQYPIYPKVDLSFMYLVHRCNKMVKKHKYDVIIGTRPDVKFLYVQPIEPMKNTFFIPRIDAHGGSIDKDGLHWKMGYSTHVWYAEYNIAVQILDSFNWTEWVYEKSGVWAGESMVKYFCEYKNIHVKPFDVSCMLIRGTSKNPCSCLPPWTPLSKTNHPEYLDTTEKHPPLVSQSDQDDWIAIVKKHAEYVERRNAKRLARATRRNR